MSDLESDRLPQHDRPRADELIQPEVDERRDSIVVEGDDAAHVLPPTELDPYTPEPGPRAGETRQFAAMWIGVIVVVLAVAAVLLVTALR